MYSRNDDYGMIALEKVGKDTTSAYRTVYLWINVKKVRFIFSAQKFSILHNRLRIKKN